MDKQNNREIIKNKSRVAWGTNPAGWIFGNNFKKGSKDFFESVLKKRFSYECDWFDEVVNFERFKGKKVLEIGYGAGYDAYRFCKAGAFYSGIDITPENQIIATEHLSHYGYQPNLFCMDIEKLSFKEEFDYIFSFGVLHHTPDIAKSLENIYKALKRGGEAQIIVYNKHSLFYWFNVVLTQWILKRGFLKRTLAEQRSLIEFTQSSENPLVNVYSRRQIAELIEKAGFTIEEIQIRKLVHEDLPIIWKFPKLISQKLLNKIGKKFGWYVSVRATKE